MEEKNYKKALSMAKEHLAYIAGSLSMERVQDVARQGLERILEVEQTPEPWLDVPDGPGWWWYAAPWSEPEEVECRMVRKKDGRLESYDPWRPCEQVGYEGYRTAWDRCNEEYGKWQRAIVPQPPKEGE